MTAEEELGVVASTAPSHDRFAAWTFARLEQWTRGRWWAARTTVLGVIVSLVVAFPSYNDLDTRDPTWLVLRARSAGKLFTQAGLAPSDRPYALTFRATVPLLAKVLHVSSVAGFLVLQALGGIAVFLLVALLVERVTRDRMVATLITLAVASTWIGATGFVELRGNFDAVALALLLAAAFFRSPLVVLVAGFAAAWTDERCVLALVLVALFHVAMAGDVTLRRTLRSPQVAAVVLAIAGYVASRLAVASAYDLSQPHTTLHTGEQINNIPAGLWVAFEGLWLLILVAFASMWQRRQRFELLFAVVPLAAITFIAVSLVDITRAFVFALPVLLVALVELRHRPIEWLRRAALSATVVTLVWPVSYVGGKSTVFWQFPLPIQLLRFAGLTS